MTPDFLQPVSLMPSSVLNGLYGVLCDIDDTLTTDGRLPAIAYAALEALADAGLAVVPVTGRPAGWCDMIARFWPVAGIIGENGAFWFRYDRQQRKMSRHFLADKASRELGQQRLAVLARNILAEVPGAQIAADQTYRETDLAIDFAEDVPLLPPDKVARIVELFVAAGATAKVSSIHVNGWFGQHDKLIATQDFISRIFGLDTMCMRERFVFCGDSPNDAPMFAYFPYACGVANVRRFVGQIETLPAYVTHDEGGAGFAELAAIILNTREPRKSPSHPTHRTPDL